MPLTNTQYDTIMRMYQKRQLDRQHLIMDRKSEIAKRSPELAAMDGEMAHLSVEKAKLLLGGSASAQEELRQQLKELAARKVALLAELGLSPEYLEPPYVCERCQDTGYIGQERCTCFKQAAIELVYSQSHLSEVLKKENFQQFSMDYYSKELMSTDGSRSSYAAAKLCHDKCRYFVDHFREEDNNIFLFGETGVGKTFLSHCVAKELLDQGCSVIYFSAQEFFDVLAQKTFQHDDAATADYQNIMECDLLIIDDLGTEMSNSFTISQFFVVLNDRLRNRKATFISSNLELYDIASVYSERVSSRLSESYMLLHLFGRDIRIQKKLMGR